MARPIFDMLEQFKKDGYKRFFMPGHKGLGDVDMMHDVTEVLYTDDLSSPSLAIKDANGLLAKAYDMDFATIVTCGSTVCVHSMLLTAKGNVLAGRDAHKSFVNACYLYDINCEMIKDVTTNGYLNGIENSNANTLYVTYPTYYGTGIDIDKICDKAHEKGMVVIVDCAHGAHFAFSDRLPSLPKKADMFCVSAHKTLGTLTQGAILLSKNKYKDRLVDNLFKIHTTSPSYLIMESIDNSRDFMENNKDLIDKWIDECKKVRKCLSKYVNLVEGEYTDITRITFSADGYNGYELFDLFARHGIIAEMADMKNIVFITSAYDIDSIKNILDVTIEKRQQLDIEVPKVVFGKKYKPISYVKGKDFEMMDFHECEGKICASALGAYPPGIAAVLPGEIITREVIEYFDEVLKLKGSIFSMDDGKIRVLK